MQTQRALSEAPSSLSHRLRLVSARERGVGAEQLPFIATDPELFEIFYGEHVEDLQRFVARRVGDRERAADLTAEIFLAAIDSAHRYRSRRGTPRTWLYGIARVLVANDRRSEGRERAGRARLQGSELIEDEDQARMDARIDAASRARHLYEAMDRLSEPERAVLELVALDELTVVEAAAAAGVRPVTARVRLHRARRRLRDELEADAPHRFPSKEDES